MMGASHNFGGGWTSDKLERVEKYLRAYATIMNNKHFNFAYIDAFAGTGYREAKKKEGGHQFILFQYDDIKEIKKYSEGSARMALRVQPEFNKYIFIEKSKKHFTELQKLKDEFPEKNEKMQFINADANSYIYDMCTNFKWQNHRAVMFLDPYGMQVEWETVKAIANTEAIDLWYLFPLGIGVNRPLKKEIDSIPPAWKARLDLILGTEEWQNVFYRSSKEQTLFGTETKSIKAAGFKNISQFVVKRLNLIFSGVASNPLLLCNSKNNPLYLLCFASGNPKGAKTAIKIAQDILKR